jgi:hypothetical protein
MARKQNIGGLLALGAVGVGAWWLFFRKNGAPAGPTMPVINSTDIDMGSAQSAADFVVDELVAKGIVPAGATQVYLVPTAPGVAALADVPGGYVVPTAMAADTGGAPVVPVAPDSGSTSGEPLTFLGMGRQNGSSFHSSFGASFARTVEEQMRSPGVFQGYGNGFMQTIETQQRGNVGSGIHGFGAGASLPYYDRVKNGNFIPFGDYVQLPYHAGA